MTVIHLFSKMQVFFPGLSIFIIAAIVGLSFGYPSEFCVEESKNQRLTGEEPYAHGSAKDARSCIALCIRDHRDRVAPCRAVVYTQLGSLCLRYVVGVKTPNRRSRLQKVNEYEGATYYEVLRKCPKTGNVNMLDIKRRDEVDRQNLAERSRPLADKQDDHGPPGVMPPEDEPSSPEDTVDDQQLDEDNKQDQQTKVDTNENERRVKDAGLANPQQQPQYTNPLTIETRPFPNQNGACCPAPLPQTCCPAPLPQPCCPAPQPQPCCPPPQPAPQQCCPAPQPQPCCPQQAPPPPQWGPWSAWTECHEVPCTSPGGKGSTVQTRTRQCTGHGQCPGEDKQHQPCGCLQGQWTEWGPPTPCSCTCGDGVQTKRRTCTVPGTCLGHDSEQVSCNAGPCPQWSEWAQADPCPMTCGRGTTVRRRQCTLGHGGSVSTGCIGDETRTEPCQSLPPCCQPWSPWSSCSTTCGQGVQTRKMTCDAGPGSTEQQPCSNPQPCCSEWSQWGGCQAICGQGYQTRTRTCDNTIPGSAATGHQYQPGRAGGFMGIPSLSHDGSCCNTLQQQPCSNGCSPNTFYQNQHNYVNGLKRVRR